jgi:hypothetical protein
MPATTMAQGSEDPFEDSPNSQPIYIHSHLYRLLMEKVFWLFIGPLQQKRP